MPVSGNNSWSLMVVAAHVDLRQDNPRSRNGRLCHLPSSTKNEPLTALLASRENRLMTMLA